MSSNIKIQRICQHCGKEFIARTTVTRYCSHRCNSSGYKARLKVGKIQQSDNETLTVKLKPLEEIKAKEFLTVRDVATLLNCSVRTVYNQIEAGTIPAVNLSERMTRIKRSVIDKLFIP